MLAGFTFENKGLRFYDAYSAAEAKELLKQNIPFSVALVDVVMETNHAGLDLFNTFAMK